MYRAYCTLIMDRFIHLQPTPTIIYERGLTMNKPTRMKILVFLLVFGMVAAFLPACAEEPAPPTTNPTTEPTEPLPTDAESLLERIDFTVLTDETFFQLQEYADALLTQNTEVNLVRGEYLHKYIIYSAYELETEMTEAGWDEPFTLYTQNYAKHKKEMQYLIILDQLLKQYDACLIYGDYKYKPEFSRNPFHILLICPSYLDSGYDSMVEYFEAMKDGTIPKPEDAYEVWYSFARVEKYVTKEELVLFPEEK